MSTTQRWTSADLEQLPDDGTRYEIIDGELFMSKQPHFFHQCVCSELDRILGNWNNSASLGCVSSAPGLIFDVDEEVVPDVIWISNGRLGTALRSDGKIHEAPELAIEVLSPGKTTARRDRVDKLALYSRRGVREYWIVNWQTRSLEMFRRDGERLTLTATLRADDVIESPCLEGFSCRVSDIFLTIPVE